jgi:hypothetical protein
MQGNHLIFIVLIILFSASLSSCALMNKEEPVFDESRVPGEYTGQITCSYEPCNIGGDTFYSITWEEPYFTLHFEDSLSEHLPDLDFQIELDRRSYGEAITISGFIKLRENQAYALTPFDQHLFYYWTYYDTQQEGERFEMRIYEPGPEVSSTNPEFIELAGYKGIQ